MKFPTHKIDEIQKFCCGCGNPDLVWESIHKYLENYSLTGDDCNKRTISLDTGEALFLAYFLTEIGLLEHGGSVHGSWLSDEGKEVLEFLRLAAPEYDAEIYEAQEYRDFVENSRNS